MRMTPGEMREKRRELKAMGRSPLNLDMEYEKGKKDSRTFYNHTKTIAEAVKRRLDKGNYHGIMDMENYYSINGTDSVLKKFSEMMLFFEEINPGWKINYNNKEEKKDGYNSAALSAEYSMTDFLEEALNSQNTSFGKISSEDMKNIRVNALTMFYANKIAHHSQFLRERYLAYVLNYEITDNPKLDSALSFGKDKDIYNAIKEYYAGLLDYNDAKQIGEDESFLKSKENKVNRKKKELEKYGLDSVDCILNDENLLRLVRVERDAYAIKDVAMVNLKNQLMKQNDISFGIKYDEEGREVFVLDLPFYGQFSVHTKRETYATRNIAKERKMEGDIPAYEYDVYGIEDGNLLLVQAKTDTMNYILRSWKKQNKRNIEDVLEVGDITEIDEIHRAAVKLGLTKSEIAKVYKACKEQEVDEEVDI